MSQKLLKAVFFDFDGTLIDSVHLLFDVYNQIAKKHQLNLITPELKVQLKHKNMKAIVDMFEDISKQPLVAQDIVKTFEEKMDDVQPIKGIEEVLQNLKNQGVKLGILTSNRKIIVERLLEKYNLNVFDMIDTDVHLFEKGNGITQRVAQGGYENLQVCYVGDEIRDIVACREAKIPIIAVNWGYNSEQALQDHQPDGLARTPEDLWCMLEQRLNGDHV